MFRLIKTVVKGAMVLVVLILGWTGYQWAASAGLVPGVIPEAVNSTGIVEKASGYGLAVVAVVVVVLVLWLALRRRQPGAIYWRD